MASTFRILQGATTLVNLDTAPWIWLSFTCNSPEIRDERAASVFRHGESVLYAKYKNVKDIVSVMVTGTGKESPSNEVEDLESAIQRAMDAILTTDEIVYVQFKPDGWTTTWRSPLYFASMTKEEPRTTEFTNKMSDLTLNDRYYTVINIELERAFYWENVNLTDIPLSNQHGSDVTTGLTVYNKNDTSYDNFVTVDGADVEGGVPAALELTMENSVNDATRVGDVHVARNVRVPAGPSTFTHHIEAEDETYKEGNITQGTGASYSNGAYLYVNYTYGSTYTYLASWQLSTSLLTKAGGRWFKILGFFTSLTHMDLYLMTRVGATNLQIGGAVKYSSYAFDDIVDFGNFQLPPYNLGARNAYPLELRMYGRNQQQWDVDYFLLMPAEVPDGYAFFQEQGYGFDYQSKLISDGPRDLTVVDWSSSGGAMGNYVLLGDRLMIDPGREQRFYFVHKTWTGVCDPTRTMKIYAKYHKRRIRL